MPGERHPDKVIERAVAYARRHHWAVMRTTGGSAHAWAVMRCPGDCPQVSIHSTPRVPEHHARALRKSVDRCPHEENEDG